MAVISAAQLQKCRQWIANEGVAVVFTKAQANAVLQAIEDWFSNGLTVAPSTSLNAAVNTVTSPIVLSNAVKKKFLAAWAREKFDIERA